MKTIVAYKKTLLPNPPPSSKTRVLDKELKKSFIFNKTPALLAFASLQILSLHIYIHINKSGFHFLMIWLLHRFDIIKAGWAPRMISYNFSLASSSALLIPESFRNPKESNHSFLSEMVKTFRYSLTSLASQLCLGSSYTDA